MKKYSTYKDSGEFWMGDIPSHWESRKLKHVFHEKKITHNTSLSCGAISFGKVITKDDDKIPLSTKASYQELLKGEYLVNPLNLNYDLKSLRIALSDLDVVVSSGYIVLKNHAKIDKSYYKWLLHRYDVAYMKLLGSGVRQTINFNHISSSLLAFPPIEEQSAIANFLDEKTDKIDQSIAQKEKLIELLKERKQVIIQNAVTKGLDPKVKMKDSGVEWIGEIPEHWGIYPIRRLFDVRDGTHDTPEYVDPNRLDVFPLVTSKDFTEDGVIDFSTPKMISRKNHLEISKRSKVEKNDVLMSMIGGNIGKSVIAQGEEYSIKNVALFKKEGDLIEAQFLMYYIISGYLDKQIELNSRGGAQGFLSLGDIRSLVYFNINRNEKEQIVTFLNHENFKIDQAINLHQTQIKKLKEYKTTLIDNAVTGKIKVC